MWGRFFNHNILTVLEIFSNIKICSIIADLDLSNDFSVTTNNNHHDIDKRKRDKN